MATLQEQIVPKGHSLHYFRSDPRLATPVAEMADAADQLASAFKGIYRNRRLFMVNSTGKGGGVAEMIPSRLQMIRQFGIETHWLVLNPGPSDASFFDFTKRLHNLIHDNPADGDNLQISLKERATYERVSQEVATLLAKRVCGDDVVIVHDPQALGISTFLRLLVHEIIIIFRCHIGLDKSTPATRAAWNFLKPFSKDFNAAVFSAAEYIPGFMAGKSVVIPPGIDPTDDKNRELSAVRLMSILVAAGFVSKVEGSHQTCYPVWDVGAQRLQKNGMLGPASTPIDFGFMFRPIISQISRWDKLKGWLPLLRAFVILKRHRQYYFEKKTTGKSTDSYHGCRLKHVGLVLAGPNPQAIQDDPEGQLVFEQLREEYLQLEDDIQSDIAIITLPMESRKHNALMVNAIHCISSVVVQNSKQEGFGLTCTEAMLKGVAVIGTMACGIRHQIINGVHGRLVHDPENIEEIADLMNDMLANEKTAERLGSKARRRVLKEFTVFGQVTRWLELFHRLLFEAKSTEMSEDGAGESLDDDNESICLD
uniref:Uncharacterized protein n=1 Tax=Spongospora subterranea TaxID=70186 RepID=A0A0H5QK97_9EUKA|eukprot:CRZ02047.1 hypothetical protein [Spongospora subterranea]